MKKSSTFLLFAILFHLALNAFAQTNPDLSKKQKKELGRLSEELHSNYKKNFKKAKEFARTHGLELYKVDKNGTIIALHGIDDKGMPLYVSTNNNIRSAATIGTDKVWPGGVLNLNLNGASNLLRDKLALWDGSQARFTHKEFQNRIKSGDNTTNYEDHSTHVAGTLMAAGINLIAKGMAFKIPSMVGFDFDNDDAEMAQAAAKYGLLVSNHSYGTIAGWSFDNSSAGTSTDPHWKWYGEEGKSEDYKFGIYSSSVAAWDKIAFNAPYYLIVKSAGNNQNQNGPAIGEPYYQRNASGLFTVRPARIAGAISSNNSYENLSTNCNAKNILTVGGVYPLNNGYNQPSDVRQTTFSSWGPTDDGRIKPDVVANSINVLSTFSANDDDYGTLSGTSMAAPSVAGSAILLQQHYSNLNKGSFMRSATLKGIIIHTASEAGITPGPDYKFGWGLMNTAKAANLISENGKYSSINERVLKQGESFEMKVTASGTEPLTITLCWTDPEGSVVPDGTINDRTLKLINDLDVRVLKNTDVYNPWVLDPSQPANAATKGDNFRDNLEKIIIENTEPGETYTVRVTHKGALQSGEQAFSLIASGIGGNSYCASSASQSDGLKISKLTVNSFSNNSTNCTGNSSYLQNPFKVEPGSKVAASVTLSNCNESSTGFIKVYVDWNSNGIFEDPGENVATSSVSTSGSLFNTDIDIPANVNVGDFFRLRVIVNQAATANSVSSCGTYNNGETEDYVLKIIPPANDISVTQIIDPQDFSCGKENQKVSIEVKNNGTNDQLNVPVFADISVDNTLIKKLTGSVTSIKAGAALKYTFTEPFATHSGDIYTISCYSSLSTDQVKLNDKIIETRNISIPPTATDLKAIVVDKGGMVLSNADSTSTAYWFDSPTATTPIAVGNRAFVSTPPATIYGSLNDFSGKIGPTSRTEYGSGENAYNQFTPSIEIKAHAPVVLESARLYIGHSGIINFSVTDAETNLEVSTTSINVKATRNPEGIGSQTSDNNDLGEVYDLNLIIPKAGDYLINISYEDDATIFRNKQDNPINYPIVLPNVLEITGNTASTSGSLGPKNYWYYFYDLKVNSLGCKSPRIIVMPKPETSNLKLFPVPSYDKITVQFDVWTTDKVQIQILNTNGQLFYKEDYANFNGPFSKEYRLDGFSSGMYFVNVLVGDKVFSGKFIVIK